MLLNTITLNVEHAQIHTINYDVVTGELELTCNLHVVRPACLLGTHQDESHTITLARISPGIINPSRIMEEAMRQWKQRSDICSECGTGWDDGRYCNCGLLQHTVVTCKCGDVVTCKCGGNMVERTTERWDPIIECVKCGRWKYNPQDRGYSTDTHWGPMGP